MKKHTQNNASSQEPNDDLRAPTARQESLRLTLQTKDGTLISQAEIEPEQLPELFIPPETFSTPPTIATKKRERLPPLTSSNITNLPDTPSFNAIRQSFGPGVVANFSLWQTPEERRFALEMPNGASLTIEGNSHNESLALYQYVTTELGPEGLKHLLVLLDVYHLATQGRDRKADAVVSIRQLLLRLGKGKKADKHEEQQKIMKTILYLARTFSSSTKGNRRSYTPLLIIERLDLEPDEQGRFQIPSEIEYHLGRQYFETLFGEQPQYFSVPTAQILAYHAVREQQELLLAIYLSNEISRGDGHCVLSFFALLVQSALQSQEDIQRGVNRTRDAYRVLYALERLERDNLIIRAPHKDIDTILAVDIVIDAKSTLKKLPETTGKRVKKLIATQGLDTCNQVELRTRRRMALQRLLAEEHDAILFSAGSLLEKQFAYSHQEIQERRLISRLNGQRRKSRSQE